MSTHPLRIREYLDHMLQAIRRIKRYTQNMTQAAFLQDDRTQDAVIRNFEIIGEAARHIERHHPEFAAQHSDVPWGIAYEMRNALAHGYFKVDLDIVWNTIHNDLPALEQQLTQIQQT